MDDDAEAISAVINAAFSEFRSLYSAGGYAATALPPELVLKRMEGGPHWVALVDGAVVGTVAAVLNENGCYVRGMAVLPGMRARGLGYKLLLAVEEFAEDSPCLYLTTTPFLHRAIQLYEQFGFVRTGEDDLHGTPLIKMAKQLPA
jgi:GNAT superfamily N-acetyltransferase